jgi:uncharacterized protein YjbI with pentapeptide repeats
MNIVVFEWSHPAAAQLDGASFVNADVQNVTFAACRWRRCSRLYSVDTHTHLLPRMPRIQMQQSRHIKSSDIFTPRTESLPAVFPEGSFMGCDLEGVAFDKRLVLSSCNFSGKMYRRCRRCFRPTNPSVIRL